MRYLDHPSSSSIFFSARHKTNAYYDNLMSDKVEILGNLFCDWH